MRILPLSLKAQRQILNGVRVDVIRFSANRGKQDVAFARGSKRKAVAMAARIEARGL